ncbi:MULTISPECIES: hypothetical protein [unclassified Paenibacillus]|uniref:hypothetical protein n=1 Tax=unclassified Paenibacillus TaxID=185978 RepID=UPI0027BA141B|nr:hypothetical protein [Paenibacillus sp. E222]
MTDKLKLGAMIQGINDSYLVLVGIGILGLVLSFFIKRTGEDAELSNTLAEN